MQLQKGPLSAQEVCLAAPSGVYELQYQDTAMQHDLTNVSDAILGHHFANLDRVITFDGADFALDGWMGFDYVS